MAARPLESGDRLSALAQPGPVDMSTSVGTPALGRVDGTLLVPCLALDRRAETHWTAGSAEGSRDTAGLAGLVARLSASALGGWLLEQAARRGVVICLDASTELQAYYRAQRRLIGLRAALSANQRVVFLAHELAHVPQHPHYSNDRRYSPAAMVTIQRFREAAAEAAATRVLAQLRDRGDAGPWAAKARTRYHDLLRAYDATLLAGGDPAASTRAAFRQWFAAPWRRNFYDAHILGHLERISTDRVGLLPTRRAAPEGYLKGIGRYGGENFLDPGNLGLPEISLAATLSPANRRRFAAIEALWPRASTSTAAPFALKLEVPSIDNTRALPTLGL